MTVTTKRIVEELRSERERIQATISVLQPLLEEDKEQELHAQDYK